MSVDEDDLYSLTLSLGSTVGTSADVKSLMPLLLERLVTGHELDPTIVLSKLVREGWRTWPAAEREAIDAYLDAVWRSLLGAYPSQVGSFVGAADFLNAADDIDVSIDPFLHAWDRMRGQAADRHLADLVTGWAEGVPPPAAVITWLHRGAVRDRLYVAFERDHEASWADDLARAYDFLAPVSSA